MNSRTWSAATLSALLLLPMPAAPAAAAEEDATLLRIFLRDGTSLVSYGEPARVGDRVVFSMPTAVTPNPPLHLVNLPAERVDWDRTDRYANAARAAHYLKGQAELDYAAFRLPFQVMSGAGGVCVAVGAVPVDELGGQVHE